jgi:uncharacterized protein with GYD domain
VPKYITFFSYTSDSAKALIDRPSDRSAAVRTLVESVGGRLEAFYWMQGDHDGFLITELPDGVAVSSLVLAVASTGAATRLQTHQVFDHDEQAAIVEKAKAATGAYKPPTA